MASHFNSRSSLVISIVILTAGFLVSHAILVHALSKNDIVFPVQALGNCNNETECRAYCDQPENSSACLAFAKEYNLVSQDQLSRWQKFADIAATGGPGGCKSEKECVSYCQDSAHIVECTDFVAKYNLVSSDELAQMQKIAAAVKQGAQLPGGCNSKDACETYCEDSSHIDECLAFAEKAQLLSPKDLAEAKQVAPYLKSGQTPGGCKSKSGCETYCSDSAHSEECASFGEKSGLMTKEEADIVRKTHGQGPGNCHSRAECETYCSNPANQQTCIDFAKQNGLVSPSESNYLDRFKDFSTCFDIATPEVQACLVNALGQENIDKMKSGILPMDLSLMTKFQQANACVAKSSQGDLNNLPQEMKSCLGGKLGPNVLEQIGTSNVSCRDVAPLQKAIDACIAEGKAGGGAEVDKCLTLSCSDAMECFNRLSEKAKQFANQTQTPDPRVKAKIDSCMNDEISVCIAKPCGEFFTCLQGLQKGVSNQQNQSQPNPELQAKMQSCNKAQQQGQQGGTSGQGTQQQPPPPSGTPPQSCQQGQYWNGSACMSYPTSTSGYNNNQLPPSSGSQPQSQVDCSAFASVPSCSYITDPQSNSLCKQCFPNK